jgi:hypothetical protein
MSLSKERISELTPLPIDFLLTFSNVLVSSSSMETRMLCMMSECDREAEETSKFCEDHLRQVQYQYRGKNWEENPWLLSTCTVEGCGLLTKTTTSRFCGKHLTRFYRHGNPDILKRSEWRQQCKIKDCMGLAVGHGYCSRHYQRLMRNGDVSINKSPEERCRKFMTDIVLSFTGDQCLTWPFYRDKDGYAGRVRWNNSKPEAACRVICRIVHGDSPSSNSQAAHNCGNGHLGCVNPKHLEWKSPKENKADELVHGTRNRGSKNVHAKLNDEKVGEIKQFIREGRYTRHEIAEMYGVTPVMVSYIKNGKNWSWVA